LKIKEYVTTQIPPLHILYGTLIRNNHVCLTNYEMLTNAFQLCYLELNCLLYCKVNTNWKFALSSASQCKTGIQVGVWSASYFYFLNSIVLSIPLKSNAPLKKSEGLHLINNHRKDKFITLPISLLFSFTIHSDMTLWNVLPICLMQLSVI
jgi:hypothetical protein